MRIKTLLRPCFAISATWSRNLVPAFSHYISHPAPYASNGLCYLVILNSMCIQHQDICSVINKRIAYLYYIVSYVFTCFLNVSCLWCLMSDPLAREILQISDSCSYIWVWHHSAQKLDRILLQSNFPAITLYAFAILFVGLVNGTARKWIPHNEVAMLECSCHTWVCKSYCHHNYHGHALEVTVNNVLRWRENNHGISLVSEYVQLGILRNERNAHRSGLTTQTPFW